MNENEARAIDAAHCWALAETAPTMEEAYNLYREARTIIVALGGPRASLVSIGMCQGLPMTRNSLRTWLLLRGVGENAIDSWLDELAGKAEGELDAIYEASHGNIV